MGRNEGEDCKSIYYVTLLRERMGPRFTYVRNTGRKPRYGLYVARTVWLRLRVTLPRLDLIAALVGARLLHYFCSETGLDIAGAVLWSDSTVALEWICSDPNRYKTFVANRVTEIQTYTSLTMEALSRRRKPCGPAVTRSHDRALAAATDLVARPIVVVKGPVPLAEPATTNAAPITGREDSLSFRAVRDNTRPPY